MDGFDVDYESTDSFIDYKKALSFLAFTGGVYGGLKFAAYLADNGDIHDTDEMDDYNEEHLHILKGLGYFIFWPMSKWVKNGIRYCKKDCVCGKCGK